VIAYELLAQHRPRVAGRDVHLWHIVVRGHVAGLCRKALEAVADTRPLEDLPDLPAHTRCATCVAAYRRMITQPLPWGAAGRSAFPHASGALGAPTPLERRPRDRP
jgi:hypothetical protein